MFSYLNIALAVILWSTRGSASKPEDGPVCLDLLMHHVRQHAYSLEDSKTTISMLEEQQHQMDNLTATVLLLEKKVVSQSDMDKLRDSGMGLQSAVSNHHDVSQLTDHVTALEAAVAQLSSQIQAAAAALQAPHPRDCSEVPATEGDGVYTVTLSAGDRAHRHVFCDQTTAGGGWLVFQRRMDGYESFQRSWRDYAQGFGNLNAEFWLGNDLLSALTTRRRRYKLRVDLEDFDGAWRYAEYEDFRVDNARNKYKLTLGTYSGNAGDAMARHSGMFFSTADRDFDTYAGNCAAAYKGAWWYGACHAANLNGAYLRGEHESYADGIEWLQWRGHHYSLKTTEMKIKPME